MENIYIYTLNNKLPSINIATQSLVIGIVVLNTITPKQNVTIGSAISDPGTKYMITAATTTPIDYMVSPIT